MVPPPGDLQAIAVQFEVDTICEQIKHCALPSALKRVRAQRKSFALGNNLSQASGDHWLTLSAKKENAMADTSRENSTVFTRRDLLKASGAALGGLAMGATVNTFAEKKTRATDECKASGCPAGQCTYPPLYEDTQRYSYFTELHKWNPKQGDPYRGIPETYIPPAQKRFDSAPRAQSDDVRVSPTNTNVCLSAPGWH